jgi:hypothetical protein
MSVGWDIYFRTTTWCLPCCCASGAALATGAVLVSKGKLERKDLGRVGEATALGAVSGGAGSAVAAMAGTVAGGAVSGVVSTTYSVLKAPDRHSKIKEAALGAASTSAALATGLAVAAVAGPAAFILSPLAGFAAAVAARGATGKGIDRLSRREQATGAKQSEPCGPAAAVCSPALGPSSRPSSTGRIWASLTAEWHGWDFEGCSA